MCTGYLKEIEDLKRDNLKREAQITNLSTEREKSRRNTIDAEEVNLKHDAEITNLKTQVKQLKQINENNRVELNKLYDLLKIRKEECDDLLQKNDDLTRELARVRVEHHGSEGKEHNYRERIISLEKELGKTKKDKEEYKSLAERFSRDLSSKNNELLSKITEIENLKSNYESTLQSVNQLESVLMKKLEASGKKK